MSNFNNPTQKQNNRLQLNSTLGGDDESQLSINAAMMDEIDQALYKCIED